MISDSLEKKKSSAATRKRTGVCLIHSTSSHFSYVPNRSVFSLLIFLAPLLLVVFFVMSGLRKDSLIFIIHFSSLIYIFSFSYTYLDDLLEGKNKSSIQCNGKVFLSMTHCESRTLYSSFAFFSSLHYFFFSFVLTALYWAFYLPYFICLIFIYLFVNNNNPKCNRENYFSYFGGIGLGVRANLYAYVLQTLDEIDQCRYEIRSVNHSTIGKNQEDNNNQKDFSSLSFLLFSRNGRQIIIIIVIIIVIIFVIMEQLSYYHRNYYNYY
eukprot:gene6974-4938_t